MKEARRHFSVGNDMYKDGRYKEALGEFDAAYRLSGRPTALLNVGDCQRQLNEYVDAYETYQAVLARHIGQLSAADKTAVQKAVAYLDDHTGQLAVASNEAGAEIVADDRVVGRTPLAAPLRLTLGGHALVVRKDGFVSFSPPGGVVQLLSKQLVRIDANLAREVLTGHLVVREESGRDVHVFVDDIDEGPAPWEGDLPPGPHIVDARGDRFAAEKRLALVTKGERLYLVLPSQPTTGRLRIVVVPRGTIELDHRLVGGESWEGDVAPGPHHIEVVLDDVHAIRDVVVARGATVEEKIPLDVPEELHEYAGIYGRLAIITLFPLTDNPHPNSVANVVGVDPGGMLGGGGTLHVGADFGVVSAEAVAAVRFTGGLPNDSYHLASRQGVSSGTCTDGDVSIQSLSGFLGPGIRVTTQDPTFRVTASIAAGLVFRHFTATRVCGGAQFSGSAGYVAPGLVFDTGILIGATPGAKFFLGALAWMDFPIQDTSAGGDTSTNLPDEFFTAPGRGYLFASGPQVYFGPTLGVQFGH